METNTRSLRLVAFAWIAVGTLGQLANELLADLGRTATLAAAAVNLVGLVTLGYSLMRDRRESRT